MKDVLELIDSVNPDEKNWFENLGRAFAEIDPNDINWKDALPPTPPKQGYSRTILRESPIELVLLRWGRQASSAIHWHQGFTGFVRVLAGEALNRSFSYKDDVLKETSRELVNQHATFPEPDGQIHLIENPSLEGEMISLHLYSPPILNFDGMVLFKEDGTYAELSKDANAASWTEPSTSFRVYNTSAFQFLPFEKQDPSHFIFPILPKPDKGQIAKQIEGYYSDQYLTYDTDDALNEVRRKYTESINLHIATDLVNQKPVSKVMHLASGTGRRAIEIKEISNLDYEITGIDANHGMCELAGKRGLDQVINDHWLSAPLPPDLMFDAITYLYAFGHVASADLRRAILAKAYHHLKPGGRLYLDVFNLNDPDEWGPAIKALYTEKDLGRYGYEQGDVFYLKRGGTSPAFLHYFTQDEITTLLEETGFEIVKCLQIGYAENPGREMNNNRGHFFIIAERPV